MASKDKATKELPKYFSTSEESQEMRDDIVYGFGDDATVDDEFDANRFRVFFQNICGIKLQQGTHNLSEIVGFLSSFRTAVVGLAETNVNWRQYDTTATVDTHLRLGFQHSRMVTSSSGFRGNTSYQAGGTLTAVLGKWSGRKLDAGSDEPGCFS